MDKEEYKMMADLMFKVPPKKETPKNQKFHIGEIVKLSNPQSWFSKKSFEKNKEQFYEIEYSYFQKYGGDEERQIKSYSLKHLFEKNSSAWYEESELELVKGITKINEEIDLAEYKRLKAKYETKS